MSQKECLISLEMFRDESNIPEVIKSALLITGKESECVNANTIGRHMK